MTSNVLAFAGCLGIGIALSVAANAGDRLTTANVNLRVGAGVDHNRIATLPRGIFVQVDDCRDGWCQIRVRERTGWVAARYLAAPRPSDTGTVERFRPSVVVAPPPVKIQPVVPRNFHDLGPSRHHEPLRNFHE